VRSSYRQLAGVMPATTLREFPRLDHFGINEGAPQVVGRAVAEFLLESSDARVMTPQPAAGRLGRPRARRNRHRSGPVTAWREPTEGAVEDDGDELPVEAELGLRLPLSPPSRTRRCSHSTRPSPRLASTSVCASSSRSAPSAATRTPARRVRSHPACVFRRPLGRTPRQDRREDASPPGAGSPSNGIGRLGQPTPTTSVA
jgi:hypothetical protein